MKTINIDLPVDVKDIILVPLADLHIGEKACDIKLIKAQIEKIANTPNCYTILNGDIMDNVLRCSIGDIYSQENTPQEQIEYAIKLFKPIKDKILAITNGNHEERTYKDCGIDLMQLLALELGIGNRYANEAAYLFLNFRANNSRRVTCTVYATHGRGGGRKEGAKAIRLADMASIVDADIYIHSHTHLPMSLKNVYYKVDNARKSVTEHERLFVNTGATLNYAKYAEKNEYKPTSKAQPIIHIYVKSGHRPAAAYEVTF